MARAIQIGGIAPATEEANPNPSTARSESFAALQSIKDRLAGVLVRPYSSQSAGIEHDVSHRKIFHQGGVQAKIRSIVRQRSASVPCTFFRGTRSAGMRVGAADESVLERIHSIFLFDHQAALYGVANVVASDRAEGVFAGLTCLPQLLKVALFVVGAQTRRTFGIAFDLKNLGDGLGPGTPLQAFRGERRAVAIFRIERYSPAEVGVVRDGKYLALAGTIFLQPLPEELGRIAQFDGAKDRLGIVSAAEDDVAMQHSQTLHTGGPFESREGREFTRVVKIISVLLNFLPHAARAR